MLVYAERGFQHGIVAEICKILHINEPSIVESFEMWELFIATNFFPKVNSCVIVQAPRRSSKWCGSVLKIKKNCTSVFVYFDTFLSDAVTTSRFSNDAYETVVINGLGFASSFMFINARLCLQYSPICIPKICFILYNLTIWQLPSHYHQSIVFVRSYDSCT